VEEDEEVGGSEKANREERLWLGKDDEDEDEDDDEVGRGDISEEVDDEDDDDEGVDDEI
jgi:hypothetical protein